MKKSEQSLKDLWDTNKWVNIYIVGVSEKREKEKKGKEYI